MKKFRPIITCFTIIICLVGLTAGSNKKTILPDRTYDADYIGNVMENLSEDNYLTKAQYDVLQISKTSRFKDRINQDETYDIFIADTLYNRNHQKVLLLIDSTGGESSGLLVSYDANGNYINDREIVYEDYVEYISATTSIIRNDTVYVKTISYEYLDDDTEKMDSVITRFIITEELKFRDL